MPTTPNGLPYPGNAASEPPNGPLQIGNLAKAADAMVVGHYATTAERDRAITSPIRGQIVTVGNLVRVHTGSEWAPVGAGMRAQRNTNTSFPTSGSWVPFASDTAWTEVDPYGMRSTGATIVAPWSGWYQLNATAYFAPNATGSRGLALQPLDGIGIGEGNGNAVVLAVVDATSAPNSTVLSASYAVELTAGQRVQWQGYQNSGDALNVNAIRISALYTLA